MKAPRLWRTLVFWVALSPALVQSQTERSDRPTLFYIPHTHWEGAVFKTREEYLAMGLANILSALRLLRDHPDYKFTLDQVAYIRPFLERYPEEEAAFRRFLQEGRLQIVGGMDVMPDDVKPGGELFLRQVEYGQRYCREVLGMDVKVGWFLDTFGHHPQMPQILRRAGYASFWFCRGVPNSDLPSEFQWEGIDGTAIQAFWLPGFYGLFYGPPREFPAFSDFFEKRFHSLDAHARGAERVGPAGVDVSEPEDYVPELIQQFNRQPDAPFTIRYAVPGEFEAVVARRRDMPVLRGDFNPIFPGTYSSRIELKQITRDVEQRLVTAEKLSALDSWLGKPPNEGRLWRAWEPVLFNQTHDLASGVMTDHVYDDTVAGYEFSSRMADAMVQEDFESFCGAIDTEGAGSPIVVFNSLGWARTDVVRVELGLTEASAKGVRLTGPDGSEQPVEVTETEHYGDGSLKRATILFTASNVPALGYSLFRWRPDSHSVSPSQAALASGTDSVLENDQLRVGVDPANGALRSISDKAHGWEALSGPANVIAQEPDKGDLWELYHGLDGGSYIAGTNRQTIPSPPQAQLSNQASGTNGVIRRGPVTSEFSIARRLGDGDVVTRVRLYSGVKRVEMETELVNRQKYVRYQALFPTTIRNGRNVQEIPFGAVERPNGIEFPAQNWVDLNDGQHGVALLNRGLPGNLAVDGTLLLSLARAENLGQYGFGGGYEPGMSSEGGFELGRRLKFGYALLPHSGDWREAQVYRAGLEYNHPLLARKVGMHPGRLGKRWGLLDISAANVVLSAVKPGRNNSIILRVYEGEGKKTKEVAVRMHASVVEAFETNLLEEPEKPLTALNDTVAFDLHPFEIKTLQIRLKPNL